MMENILDIIDDIAKEKGLNSNSVFEIVSNSLIEIAKDNIGEEYDFIVEKDTAKKNIRLFKKVIVAEKTDDTIPNIVGLEEAKNLANTQDVHVGDTLNIEISLDNLNKTAINKMFFSLDNNLQKQIEENILNDLRKDIGKIVVGNVLGIDDDGNTFVEIRSLRAILPLKNRIKNERFQVGKSIRAILKKVNFVKDGISIELSRTTPKFLEELLAQEVPEIANGEVEVIRSARIPGVRAKVALISHNPRIDPIGSSVGVKGVRINAVSGELNGENIDCVEYSDIAEIFIARSLSPANVISVVAHELNKENEDEENKERPKAVITIDPSQKAKAIGKEGVNIRLCSMITGYDIEINEINSNKTQDEQEAHTPNETPKVGVEALESLFKS